MTGIPGRAIVIAALTAALIVPMLPSGAHHRVQKGRARYYSNELEGNGMACGGKYRADKMVAAHRRLPCGTRVRVKNRANGREVTLTVRDRGPYGDKKVIVDVSRRAARKLDFLSSGSARVRVTVVHEPDQ